MVLPPRRQAWIITTIRIQHNTISDLTRWTAFSNVDDNYLRGDGVNKHRSSGSRGAGFGHLLPGPGPVDPVWLFSSLCSPVCFALLGSFWLSLAANRQTNKLTPTHGGRRRGEANTSISHTTQPHEQNHQHKITSPPHHHTTTPPHHHTTTPPHHHTTTPTHHTHTTPHHTTPHHTTPHHTTQHNTTQHNTTQHNHTNHQHKITSTHTHTPMHQTALTDQDLAV